MGRLRSPLVHIATFPLVTWIAFIATLWIVHLSGFYEAALEGEGWHRLEHALFLTTALAFWLPVIVAGPVPWTSGPLAHPLRMLYLFVAMPAESLLGFVIATARHPLYAHYATAGMDDQRAAGAIMWIGAGLCMFAAFMATGAGWALAGRRRDRREAARLRTA